MIRDNISRIREDIARLCERLGRDRKEITLVAVTKYAEGGQIKEAIQAGIADIGENRVQEAEAKFRLVHQGNVTKHMIGHLQTNKVRQALKVFDMIQSVDRVRLVEDINKQAGLNGKTVKVLVQVNTSREVQKFGIDPDGLIPLIQKLADLKYVHLLGLMTMAPLTEDKDCVRNCFKILRGQFQRIKEDFAQVSNIEMKYLSMGMSQDYATAIEEGSNMVRIGSAIFK